MRNTYCELVYLLGKRLGLNEYEISFITPSTLILSVCDDSLDLLDAIMVIEDHFGINIPSPEKFKTVSELHAYINKELDNG